MTPVMAAITQFSITLICILELYAAFVRRHHRPFFVLIIPAIVSLIFGLKILGVM
jgi:hypothetical protein